MKTHAKITALAGFGLLLMMLITGFFLRNALSACSAFIAETERASLEMRQIEAMAQELAIMSTNIQEFIASSDNRFRRANDVSRVAVHHMLDDFETQALDPEDRRLCGLIHDSFISMEKTSDRLFSLKEPAGRDRESARRVLLETVRLATFMNADIGAFRKGRLDASIGQMSGRTRALQTNIVLFVVMVLLLAVVLLLGFAIFIRRAVFAPLNRLREGAKEFGRGNLDYRLHTQGTDEIALIAGQMNGMADSLKRSFKDLEDRLSENTDALAAIGQKGIAVRHEINNPLTTVIGNVELLIERWEHKDKDLTARLEVVLDNALKIAEITRMLQEIKKENIANKSTAV